MVGNGIVACRCGTAGNDSVKFLPSPILLLTAILPPSRVSLGRFPHHPLARAMANAIGNRERICLTPLPRL